MMRDIRQEELDKAFMDGALAVESAVLADKSLTSEQKNALAVASHGAVFSVLGEERMARIQGQQVEGAA